MALFNKNMKFIAIIPARGGSKEITGKKNQYRKIPDSRGYYQHYSGGDSYIAINDNIR